ncbi:MAG: cysteine desulfurase [Actinomycetales bacterium]|nr:cysteine desulfurase [Actinomycetales bacterium]
MAYLDHAATTPMFPAAVAAMTELLADPGNPSSLHAAGRKARRHVEESREQVANAIGARPGEVIFTAGGTEANNIAIKGIAWAARNARPNKTRLVVSSVEHHAALDPVQWLVDDDGFEVTWIKASETGEITAAALRDALGSDPSDVALVSVMMANNEVGTINDIAALTEVTREFGIGFHTDAVQAPMWLDVNFAKLGVCAMSISGHKFGGPTGAGALIMSRDCRATPLIHGGGQERELRSGTLDTPSIVGLASGLTQAVAERTELVGRISALRDELVRGVLQIAPDAIYNGATTNRLANNAHFSFPGALGDSLLMLLDAQGVECSVGSACSAGVPQPSHVLLAMDSDPDLARCTLRFSLGHTSTSSDVDALLDALPSALERARRAGVPRSTAGVAG